MKQAALAIVLAAGAQAAEPGFKPLFDGTTLNGWSVARREGGTGSWTVSGSVLAVSGRPGMLVSDREFGDLDLRLQWAVEPLGNSGVFYRYAGDGNPAGSAVECQIADNARTASQRDPKRRAGAAYGRYAPDAGAARPPGEWNDLRILVRGSVARHWLNGRLVVEFDFASDDFRRRAAAAKKGTGLSQARSGRIALQDHNSTVSFRNVRIRRLD